MWSVLIMFSYPSTLLSIYPQHILTHYILTIYYYNTITITVTVMLSWWWTVEEAIVAVDWNSCLSDLCWLIGVDWSMFTEYYRAVLGHQSTPILDLAGGCPIPGGIHLHGWAWVRQCVWPGYIMCVYCVHKTPRVETTHQLSITNTSSLITVTALVYVCI